MKTKTIEFEKWLINNYPEREDNSDYSCETCEGDGYVDSDVEYIINNDAPDDVEYCGSCFGTGSSMYSEYEKQCEIDENRLAKFLGENKYD